MNFNERFERWKQEKRDFNKALREAVIIVARHKNPTATMQQLEDHADLAVFAIENRHEILTGMPPVEVGVIPKLPGIGSYYRESMTDDPTKVTIDLDLLAPKLLGEYHPEGITSTLLDPKPDSVASGARGDNLPDVHEVELPMVEVVVDPALKEKLDASLLEVRGRAQGEAPPGWQKPFSLCRPDDVIDVNVSTGDEVEIKPVPSAPYERAVAASDLWRMIVDEGETGRTNSWIEQYFERLQEKYYGKVFLKIQIDGLQVSVQHLNERGAWVKL